MKWCKDCRRKLPSEAYYAHPASRDGLSNRCKECAKARSKENRAKNIERYRAYDLARAKQPDRKEAMADLQRMRRLRKRADANKRVGLFSKLTITKRMPSATVVAEGA